MWNSTHSSFLYFSPFHSSSKFFFFYSLSALSSVTHFFFWQFHPCFAPLLSDNTQTHSHTLINASTRTYQHHHTVLLILSHLHHTQQDHTSIDSPWIPGKLDEMASTKKDKIMSSSCPMIISCTGIKPHWNPRQTMVHPGLNGLLMIFTSCLDMTYLSLYLTIHILAQIKTPIATFLIHSCVSCLLIYMQLQHLILYLNLLLINFNCCINPSIIHF